jgi:hypothetical protein
MCYHDGTMIRTQIQLTPEQAKALRRLAAAEGVSQAELVRRFVDEGLLRFRGRGGAERVRRALAVVGRFRSGHRDVSERHDRHLDEAYGE